MGSGNTPYSSNTFYVLLNWLSGKMGLPDFTHRAYNPTRWVNGYDLGNVATTFYAFLYDGGYLLYTICTILMAIISQGFVVSIRNRDVTNRNLSLVVLSYGYVIFTCLFSFFSNKFYEMVFTNIYLFMIIHWILIRFFIINISVGKKEFYKV